MFCETGRALVRVGTTVDGDCGSTGEGREEEVRGCQREWKSAKGPPLQPVDVEQKEAEDGSGSALKMVLNKAIYTIDSSRTVNLILSVLGIHTLGVVCAL